jgi:isoleucyl-tRNA synthetase
LYWIRCAALLATPIAPHFAEHIWMSILQEPTSIQVALWPTPKEPVDRTIVETAAYMHETIKSIQDAEAMLMKRLTKSKDKNKSASFEPKSVRIYVAMEFPAWQNQCVQVIKDAYSEATQSVDDAPPPSCPSTVQSQFDPSHSSSRPGKAQPRRLPGPVYSCVRSWRHRTISIVGQILLTIAGSDPPMSQSPISP